MKKFQIYSAISLGLVFLLLTIGNIFTSGQLKKAKSQIDTQTRVIAEQNTKIKNLKIEQDFERQNAIAAFEDFENSCAGKIRNAVAGVNVPPREKIVFKTKIVEVENSNENQNSNACPDLPVVDGYGLRDIQTAGINN